MYRAKRKNKIIQMIKHNEPIPRHDDGNWSLYFALQIYTNPNHKHFDIDFVNEIKYLNPEWLPDHPESHKSQLLQLAKENNIPDKNSALYESLIIYQTKGHRWFDIEFTEKLRNINPDWYFNKETFKYTIRK